MKSSCKCKNDVVKVRPLLNSLTPFLFTERQLRGLTSLFIITFLLTTAFAQDSISYSWENKGTINIHENETWALDAFENIYLSNNGTINKFDSEGALMFSQSIKSLGDMKQLVLVNTMKLVHFSEDQQTLCYFDNTLSPMDDCIDLAEENIVNASLVCSSAQPDKIWVLDNLNSTLNLLSLDRTNQSQQIRNLKGILNIGNISQMKESGNRLYLLDQSKGVYIFDMYGSLIEFIEDKSIQYFEVVGSTLFTLMDDVIHIHAVDRDDVILVSLPVGGVLELKAENETLYFRTDKNVHKFKLVFQ
ncbi:MAG TPA: hypothetical protein EYG86_06835 [Crocinitomicaceae bacterium]|nr:hypothetical protein [Crocinitomicaceae bacterium]